MLNTYWRDWRLAYAEVGVGCWAATVPAAGLSRAAAAAYLNTLWGCTNSGDCSLSPFLVTPTPPSGPASALGLVPNVTISAGGLLTFFPAPPDLQPSCDAAVIAASGAAAPPWCNAPLSSTIPGLAGAVWSPLAVPCQGLGARRLLASTRLDSGQAGGGPPMAGGGPGGLDWNAIWDPALEDSFNQDGPDAPINEEWTLFANGTVKHMVQLQNVYSISGKFYQAFPYDRPVYVATRRSYATYPSDVLITITASGIALPQEMDGFFVETVGATICMVHDSGNVDASDCGQPGAAPCSQMLVMYMQLRRDPTGWVQNMIAPITLVVILIASAFYTDLDSYDTRSLIMGTSMIALMALLPYLATSLPSTSKVTFIHSALFTCYGLLGVGLAVVIAVSFFLSHDIMAAMKPRGEVAQPEDSTLPFVGRFRGCLPKSMITRAPSRLRKKAMKLSTIFAEDEGIQCKPWVMRLYYHECTVYKRLLAGTATSADCGETMVYFRHAAAMQAARLRVLGEGQEGGSLESADVVMAEGEGVEEAANVHLPANIPLRLFLTELDLSMRYLVIGVYFAVMLVEWKTRQVVQEVPFRCSDLVSYFADTSVSVT